MIVHVFAHLPCEEKEESLRGVSTTHFITGLFTRLTEGGGRCGGGGRPAVPKQVLAREVCKHETKTEEKRPPSDGRTVPMTDELAESKQRARFPVSRSSQS